MIDTIIQGDCLDILSQIEDESLDLVLTDPPYGISFMGKSWDKALPSVDVWRECLRVLKPGAFAFVMCIPRQDCLSRMIINLEDAGFMVNFSPILWAYATGFPKAMSISKAIDRRAGVEREVVGKKEGTYANIKRDTETGQDGLHGGIAKDRERVEVTITAPATPEAKDLEGSYAGLQMKPAYEVIICVMKPCTEKTYLDQALANGHGCTQLDAGRIPYKGSDLHVAQKKRESFQGVQGGHSGPRSWEDDVQIDNRRINTTGRFAPNLLVSDDALNDGRVSNNYRPNQQGNVTRTGEFFGNARSCGNQRNDPQDSGSYSRYFSLDAWAEANLPDSVKRTFPFLIVPKASKSEKNAGLDGDGCKHPTVKPIKLMSYLIAIGSRPGDVVCDPYGGSGTTGVAAALLDRRYILMEQEAEYADMGPLRIAWHVQQAKDEEQSQLKLAL